MTVVYVIKIIFFKLLCVLCAKLLYFFVVKIDLPQRTAGERNTEITKKDITTFPVVKV